MKKILYLLVVAIGLTACDPYGSQIPKSLIGNYLNFSNGNWECGLFEEFAIYQNDFWDYESATESEIVLTKKSGEKAVLKFGESSNDFREIDGKRINAITINGTKVLKCKIEPDFLTADFISDYQMFDGIEKDTSSFKKHQYAMDTAVVRIYLRNMADGIIPFMKRVVNRQKSIEVFNYLEARNVTARPLDSTDHYGYRYEIKIPVTGVSELTMSDLFSDSKASYKSAAKQCMNYVVEPGDTLMFYFLEADKSIYVSAVDISSETYCSGGNQRFNSEKNASIGLQTYFNSDKYETACENCKVPVSNKFNSVLKLKNHYTKLREKMGSDSLQSIFPISEDEVFSSISVYEFILDYIKQHADYLVSTPENLAAHPDWIIAETDRNNDILVDSQSENPLLDFRDSSSFNKNILINPEFIKNLGFSDDFIEFYRLSHAVQFFDDFSPRSNDLTEAEYQSIMQHITKEDYKNYLVEKMNSAKKDNFGMTMTVRLVPPSGN